MVSQYDGYKSMMDFTPKASITSVNMKGLDNKINPEYLHAEIVLLDRSNEQMRPLLYQFKNDHIHKDSFDSIEKNAFIIIGEVDSINKKKKEIYLTNYRTVTYKYLVAASGLRQTALGDIHDEELSAGVLALWEALRVRNNSFPPLNSSTQYEQSKKSTSLPQVTQQQSEGAEHVQKVATPKAFGKTSESSSSFSSSEKRVYELQL
jgi:hypothetical protein